MKLDSTFQKTDSGITIVRRGGTYSHPVNVKAKAKFGTSTDTAKVFYIWSSNGKKWAVSMSTAGTFHTVTVTP